MRKADLVSIRSEVALFEDENVRLKREMTAVVTKMDRYRSMKTDAERCIAWYQKTNPELADDIQRTLDYANEQLLLLHFEHAALRQSIVPTL